MIVDTLAYENAKQRHNVICICDFCGIQFERLKHNIQRSHKYNKKDSCSDVLCVQKKRVEVNQQLFGTDNTFQNADIKKKIEQTNIEKYGVSNVFQNKEIQEKQKKTCMEKYGSNNVFGNKDIQDKLKNTLKEKYGVTNITKDKKIKRRQEKTNVLKYGVEHALQFPEFRKKAMETCIANHGKFPANNYGKTQQDIQNWLNTFGFDFKSTRDLFAGFEIDMFDANKKVAIEYCGLHWHHELSSESRNNPQYHRNKYRECLKQNIQLITIFSDEWLQREKQCKGHILATLGVVDRKIFARKCIIKEIDKNQGRKFFDNYHIQGANKLGIIFFGLFYENELIGVMSLGRHNRQYSNLVLDRLCFKEGIQVLGGASKLFAKCKEWAKQNNYTEILSFSDNRWSLGKVYEAMDFRLEKESGPDYSYVIVNRPNKRISKQSQKKSVTGCPEKITEIDWAHANGLARIWDCGKKRWIYKLC